MGMYDTDDKLDWQPKKTFQKDSVTAEVTSAIGRSGRELLSFNLSHTSKKGRQSKHLPEIGLDAALDVLQQAKAWRDEYRAQQEAERRAREA